MRSTVRMRRRTVARWAGLALVSAGLLTGCFTYSFTGARDLEGVETLQVDQFVNIAPLVNPQLAPDFSELVRDLFIRQSNLTLTDRGGDIQITGQITDYRVRPANITSNETAAQNRLTISISVTYVNRVYPDLGWEDKTFSQFEDFDADEDFSSIENDLVANISERLAQDIFNKTLANW